MRSLQKHILTGATLGLIILAVPACTHTQSQATFATPEAAAGALHQALQTQDMEELEAIFGREIAFRQGLERRPRPRRD